MQKLFHTTLPVLLTMLFTHPVAAVESNITTFEEALEDTGWSVYRTFSGDLVLTAPSEKRAIPIASDDIDLKTLANQLEAAGWKVQRKTDGSLDLHPRETAKIEEPTTREEAPAPSPADEQWSRMQQQLKAAGWDASRDADGSLVLIPPGETVETTTQKDETVPSAVDRQWELIQQQLKAVGWDASRDADGSLVLIPPGDPVQAATTPEKENAAPEKQADSMQTMQEKLKETGWRVTENSDGSIIFYPPKQQRSGKGAIRPASGHAPPADIDLPITSWMQARSLTLKWLKLQSSGNLTLGKIREIYDVYLVSILNNFRSDRLKYQIAIRKSDGHIIILSGE